MILRKMDSSIRIHGLYGDQWLSTPEVASLWPWYAFVLEAPHIAIICIVSHLLGLNGSLY